MEHWALAVESVSDTVSIPRIKTAVLISGRGSNMTALIEAAKASDYPAEVSLVISNRPDAKGLLTAREHGIEAICIDHKAFKNRQAFEETLQEALTTAKIELICCAGFMRVLTAWFVDHWPRRMINIHPSLLPKYKGLHTHKRALEAGDTEHGCTVHWISSELDSGETVLQEKMAIHSGDTEESLATRLLEKELTLYPKALRKVATSLQTGS